MNMRAKMLVTEIVRTTYGEILKMSAVAADSYPEDGHDDDNTYARWSPSATLELHVVNPALFGKYNPGDKLYVDFTPAAPREVPPTV